MELTNFILSYFGSKHIAFITAFLCWGQEDHLQFLNSSFSRNLRVSLETRPEVLQAAGQFREGVLLDTNCPEAREVVEYASQIRAFNHRFTWLLLQLDNYNSSTVEYLLESAAILPDSDVVWVSLDTILDVYRVKPDMPLATSVVGTSVSATQQQMAAVWEHSPSTVVRRKDLGNVFLNAAVLLSQPQYFKGWNDLSHKEIDTFPKFTYPLLLVLAEDLNFRYNMRQVAVYGVERNGSFDGLAGLLQRHRVEIGITSMFMRADRWRVLHFSSETIVLRGAFIFRQPSQSAVSNIFLLPFSRGVWVSVTVVFLFSGAFVAVFSQRLRKVDAALAMMTPGEAVTFTVGAICQQGFHITPNLMSIRVAMFVTLLSSVFAFTSYSAKIVAILQTPSDAIKTIADLAQSPMACGVQETTYKNVYFAESTDPTVQHLYRHKLLPQGERAYLSVVDGVQKMRDSFFAFQVETSSGYEIIGKTFTEHEKCSLKEIEAFSLPMPAVPIRKYSGYRDLIASRLRWQREVGIMARYRRIWLTSKPRCDASAAGFVSVGLADCLPAVQALGCGALLAAAALVAELLAAKISQRQLH